MLNNNYSNGNRKIYATFLLTKNNKKKELGLNGQNAKTLLTLLRTKNNGISTFEGFGFGLPRLSGYICVLRHEYNINIITIREEHIGGWHGRYVLVDMVEIGKVFGSKTQGGFNA